MDVLYFLTERMLFIRHFYEEATAPFIRTKNLIDTEQPPFVPPYHEDGEPEFVNEWSDADDGLEIIGQTCISMLSESLKLYFQTWETMLNLDCGATSSNVFKNRGFLAGYMECFKACCGVDFANSPADLSVLEQIILARNDAQHADEIWTVRQRHRNSLKKHGGNLFFATEAERESLAKTGTKHLMFLIPRVHVDSQRLEAAIAEVNSLAGWLEEEFRRVPAKVRTEVQFKGKPV